jgi:hypothetical protein
MNETIEVIWVYITWILTSFIKENEWKIMYLRSVFESVMFFIYLIYKHIVVLGMFIIYFGEYVFFLFLFLMHVSCFYIVWMMSYTLLDIVLFIDIGWGRLVSRLLFWIMSWLSVTYVLLFYWTCSNNWLEHFVLTTGTWHIPYPGFWTCSSTCSQL